MSKSLTIEERVYNLSVELNDAKYDLKEAKEAVKIRKDEVKRIQAEIDEILNPKEKENEKEVEDTNAEKVELN